MRALYDQIIFFLLMVLEMNMQRMNPKSEYAHWQ